jgi:hypothetical protein
MQQLTHIHTFPLAIELERFQGDVQPQLAPVLEAVGNALLPAVETNRNVVDQVCLNPLTPRRA